MSRPATIHILHDVAKSLAREDAAGAQAYIDATPIAGERTAWDLDAIRRALQLDLTSAGQLPDLPDPPGWRSVEWSRLPDGSSLVTGLRGDGSAQARRYLRDMRGGAFYVPVRGQFRGGVWATGSRSRTVDL